MSTTPFDAQATRLAARHALATADFTAAATQAHALLTRLPNDLEALGIFAHATMALGQIDEAIAALEILHQHAPDHAAVRADLVLGHHRRATQAHRQGDVTTAQAGYDRALALQPDHAASLFNRAKLAIAARHEAVALPDLRTLVRLKPDDTAAALLLAETELATGDTRALTTIRAQLATPARDATARLRLARALADGDDTAGALDELHALPDDADIGAAISVAQRLAENGDAVAARAAYAHLATMQRDRPGVTTLQTRLGAALALPSVYASHAHVADERRAFADGLDTIARSLDHATVSALAPRLDALRWSNYLLAFQGGNDRALVSRYGDWLASAAAQVAPSLAERPTRAAHATPRVGLLSSAFCHSSVGAYFGAWIGALRDAGFDTRLFQLGPTFDNETTALGRDASALIRLDGDLDTVARDVRDHALDVLIYPDLGVDPRVLVLGALRLARRQVMAWGLPDSGGLPTIDAFLTCAEMEPDDAASHYREPLLMLPGIGTRYRRPAMPPSLSRAELGLPAGRLYLIPQTPAKLHPDLDAVCARIAALDEHARLVFFAGGAPGASRVLMRRLDRALRAEGVDPAARVVLLSPGKRSRFLQICAACDVMVDSPHWSGGNTTIDALLAGLPVVACPGALMRGRQSLAMLRRLELTDALVCADGESQARRAVVIANDPAERARLTAAISQRLGRLLDDDSALKALVAHVRTLAA